MKRLALPLFIFPSLFLIASPFLTAQGTSAIWRDFTAWKEPQNAERIPGWILNLLVRDFRDVGGPAREELLAKTLSELKGIVSDTNIVPPTRYNAILAVGQLVSKEGVAGVRLPEAYPAALTTLVDLYQESETPHYLQYGALLGIVRHTVCGIAPAERDKVMDLLLETITTEYGVGDVPLSPNAAAPMEPAVWDWFRQTALEGISALRTTGTENKIVSVLLSVINGKSLKLEFLCRSQETFTRDEREQTRRAIELASKAAKTLGDLDYKSGTDVDADAIADTFIALVKAVCEATHKMAADSTIPMEQIVIDIKTCLQSVVWGIRSGFLMARQADHSLYASLKNEDPATKRLNMLMAEILELSSFLDEGDKANKPSSAAVLGEEANVLKKAFKFDLPALREALAKSSQALATMQRENQQQENL